MCGRYTLSSEKEAYEIKQLVAAVNRKFNVLIKDGDIRPSDLAPVIRQSYFDKDDETLDLMNWGYDLPYKKGLIINARSETVLEKPLFREDFISRRCLIPATGFYEWDPNKNQHLFYAEKLIYFAGIYKSINGVNKYVVLTKSPNALVAGIHDRMPVIIPPEMASTWLTDLTQASELLKQDSISLKEKACDNIQLKFPLDH
ncbi:MAG: SOS response-associated peptidase [Acetobacterium sp.]|nr:SOS response-associated peptidase [Bacillota bacterium]MCG2729814.1 SOS response-associated peptidase [Acetobacterium sp.]